MHGDKNYEWQEWFLFFICRGVVDNGARMEKLVQNTESCMQAQV